MAKGFQDVKADVEALKAAFSKGLAEVNKDVAAQGAEIARLKDLVANGTVSQADWDGLSSGIEDITAKLNALDPVADTPAPPVEPPLPPTV